MKKVKIILPITLRSGEKAKIVIAAEASDNLQDLAKVVRLDEPIIISMEDWNRRGCKDG